MHRYFSRNKLSLSESQRNSIRDGNEIGVGNDDAFMYQFHIHTLICFES